MFGHLVLNLLKCRDTIAVQHSSKTVVPLLSSFQEYLKLVKTVNPQHKNLIKQISSGGF